MSQATATTPAPGNSDLTFDFGFTPPVTIGDYVFKDNNDNGIQDGGDTPIAGVTVHLYDPSNILIATAVTDANGNYTFSSAIGTSTGSAIDNLTSLLANTSGYTIKLDKATDYTTGPLAGLTLSPTNAAGSTTGQRLQRHARRRLQPVGRLDAGTWHLGPHVRLRLRPAGHDRRLRLQGQQRQRHPGRRRHPARRRHRRPVRPGRHAHRHGRHRRQRQLHLLQRHRDYHRQRDRQPSQHAAGQHRRLHDQARQGGRLHDRPAGRADAVAHQRRRQHHGQRLQRRPGRRHRQATAGTPAPGNSDLTFDFGFAPPVTIGDYVFNDVNGNGIQDGGDTPIAGVTVNLYNAGGTLIATAVTDANGNYTFSSAIGTSTGSAIDNLTNTLLANTSGFTIKLNNPADYTTGPLAGAILRRPTPPAAPPPTTPTASSSAASARRRPPPRPRAPRT